MGNDSVVFNFTYELFKCSWKAAFGVNAYYSKCTTGPFQIQTCLESCLKFVCLRHTSLIPRNFIDLWANSKMENDFNLDIIRMSESHSAPLRLLLARSWIYFVVFYRRSLDECCPIELSAMAAVFCKLQCPTQGPLAM